MSQPHDAPLPSGELTGLETQPDLHREPTGQSPAGQLDRYPVY